MDRRLSFVVTIEGKEDDANWKHPGKSYHGRDDTIRASHNYSPHPTPLDILYTVQLCSDDILKHQALQKYNALRDVTRTESVLGILYHTI